MESRLINERDPRVLIISILFLIGVLALITGILGQINEWVAPVVIKILFGLMALSFCLDRIIFPISNWLVKFFEGLFKYNKLSKAFEETIEKDEDGKD